MIPYAIRIAIVTAFLAEALLISGMPFVVLVLATTMVDKKEEGDVGYLNVRYLLGGGALLVPLSDLLELHWVI